MEFKEKELSYILIAKIDWVDLKAENHVHHLLSNVKLL